jgi:hypothetical protein
MMSDASNRRRFPADNVGALKRGKHGVAIAGAAIILLFFSAGGFAEGVEVRGDDGGKHVLIKVDDMTMDAVLDGLQKRYGFAIEGLSNVQSDEFSEVMDGSLDDVLERLLRNRNHMIVHSAEIKAGISKVMILNSDYGIAPPDENSDGQPHRIDPVDSGEP